MGEENIDCAHDPIDEPAECTEEAGVVPAVDGVFGKEIR